MVATVAMAFPAWRSFQARRASVAAPAVEEAAPPVLVQEPAPVEPAAPVVAPPETDAPSSAPLAASDLKRRRRTVSVAPRPPAPSPGDSLADETQRLSTAIVLLRKRFDPRGALEALDDYRRAYPRAHFTAEARVVRIEALLALGSRREALAELSPAEIPSLPRGEELWVVRGEILLELNQFREALDAFNAALRDPMADVLTERALAGRARAQRSLPR